MKPFYIKNATILVIDDNPTNLDILYNCLSTMGARILAKKDGESGIDIATRKQPDIILLDIIMPNIDGYETCRRLKANPLTQSIPILFMTGLSELTNLLRGFGEGGLDYIIKPIRPPEVLARIEVHLSLARARQRAENALNQSSFSALAVNSQGVMTWLTPSAMLILNQLIPNAIIQEGQLLPSNLLHWFLHNRETDYQDKTGLTIKLTPCQNSLEYLLLLKRAAGDWHLESLKEALGLTFREAEILMWISRGKTNKEVGLILDSSHRTVNKHLEHIYEKLGVTTRAAAVAMVLQKTGGY